MKKNKEETEKYHKYIEAFKENISCKENKLQELLWYWKNKEETEKYHKYIEAFKRNNIHIGEN